MGKSFGSTLQDISTLSALRCISVALNDAHYIGWGHEPERQRNFANIIWNWPTAISRRVDFWTISNRITMTT